MSKHYNNINETVSNYTLKEKKKIRLEIEEIYIYYRSYNKTCFKYMPFRTSLHSNKY